MITAFKSLGIVFDNDYENYNLASSYPTNNPKWYETTAEGLLFKRAECVPQSYEAFGVETVKMHSEKTPYEKCSCGIYSLKSLSALYKENYGKYNFSLGLWGKIIEGELGYRSEYAGLLALYPNPCGMCDDVAANIIILKVGNYNFIRDIHRCSLHTTIDLPRGAGIKTIISYTDFAKTLNVQMAWETYPEILRLDQQKKVNSKEHPQDFYLSEYNLPVFTGYSGVSSDAEDDLWLDYP